MPRLFLALLFILFAVTTSFANPPNIVFIMADDLGYGELGCYGQTKLLTPNIDKIAAEGMKFTQCYSGSHVCAPSRSTLMTGLHPGHTPVRANGLDRHLYDADITVAEVLKEAGYKTGGFGKWGLGRAHTPGIPTKQGFDEFFGFYSQKHAHFFYPFWVSYNEREVQIPENRNGKRGRYVHDVIHEQAIRFINENKVGPFFAYLPYTIPHVELTVPEESKKPFRGKWPEFPLPDPRKGYIGSDEPLAELAGMIARLDDQVGEVMALLKELGIDDNTLVIFTSDNGGQGGAWLRMTDFFQGNGPLRGHKGAFLEGGIRVPMIARWPGKIKPGTTTDHQTAFWDFLPTAADIAGVEIKHEIDGISYLPTLLGKPDEQQQHEYLYWSYPRGKSLEVAVRWGDWKAVQARRGGEFELYDLSWDIGESTNVADAHPDVIAKIKQFAAREESPEREYPPAKAEPVEMFVKQGKGGKVKK